MLRRLAAVAVVASALRRPAPPAARRFRAARAPCVVLRAAAGGPEAAGPVGGASNASAPAANFTHDPKVEYELLGPALAIPLMSRLLCDLIPLMSPLLCDLIPLMNSPVRPTHHAAKAAPM